MGEGKSKRRCQVQTAVGADGRAVKGLPVNADREWERNSRGAIIAMVPCVSHSGNTIVPGVTDTGNHCDDCATAITFPFPVSVYGQTFNGASVSSNGSLDLTSPLGFPFTHGCLTLPDSRWGMAIFPYQDDQRTDAGLPGCTAWANGCGIFTVTTGTAPNR